MLKALPTRSRPEGLAVGVTATDLAYARRAPLRAVSVPDSFLIGYASEAIRTPKPYSREPEERVTVKE